MNTNTGGAKLVSRHTIVNLSATSNERNRTHQVPPDTNKTRFSRPTKAIKKLHPGGYMPRTRHPNEAGPQTGDWKKSVYKVGDGDTIQHPRPGSMHAYTLPSHGNRT